MGVVTKRDYELIAAVVRDSIYGTAIGWRDRKALAERFAKEIAERNPRFDRERFLIACEVES